MNKANKQNEKAPIATSKSFMTAGPTLHYSHKNVVRCWMLAFFVFALSCIFWSKILSGSFWSFDLQTVISPSLWHLGQSTITGVSIFEYPWQISVLGLLMGILAIVPVLISQLMSFSYCLPFIVVLLFLANLPGFALSVLLGCFAAACRPLRFRSRFVAIALCTLPQLVYWGYFGSAWGIEPVKWGFSFAPWICAWMTSLGIAGGVLGIGHYTRYRPGLVWIFTCIVLVAAVGVFEITIGFDDLDYQLYVAKNNPEQADEFHQHSIEEALDTTITNPSARVKRYLESSFYPTERIPLRAALKEKIQSQLALDLWPNWFTVPPELRYQEKRQWLFSQYDLFINRRPASPRMPIALYYKAILSEYRPDIKALGQKDVLRFYNDYPYERSQDLWYWLYTDFGDSPESIEARWRIARVYAGRGEFEMAEKLLTTAQTMAQKHRTKLLQKDKKEVQRLFSPFCPPADSAITISKLDELERRIKLLRSLIGPENRNGKKASKKYLAEFILLNPYDLQFEGYLDDLLEVTGSKDGLRDNILLAKAKLIADEQLRSEKLSRLHNEFKKTDGGMQALYELGLLKIRIWNKKDDANTEQKNKALAEARVTLAGFIKLYPDSIFTNQVSKNLADLPTTE